MTRIWSLLNNIVSTAFTIFQTDAGTSPVADGSNDTLSLTSSDSSVTITGNSTTDSINFQVASANNFVKGPSAGGSTDNAIARWDSTTGRLIQNSAVTINDSGTMFFPSNGNINFNSGSVVIGEDGVLLMTAQSGAFFFCNSGDYSFIADNGDLTFTGNNSIFGSQNNDFQGKIKTRTSGTSSIAKIGGCIFGGKADVNNSGTSETDIYTDTLPTSCIVNVFDKLYARYGGIFTGAVTATQQIRAYFGGTLVFDSAALAIGATTPAWDLELNIQTASSAVIRCTATFHSGFSTLAATSQYTEVTGLTLSNTQVIKVTGTAAGAAGGSNQITGKQYYINWIPAHQ